MADEMSTYGASLANTSGDTPLMNTSGGTPIAQYGGGGSNTPPAGGAGSPAAAYVDCTEGYGIETGAEFYEDYGAPTGYQGPRSRPTAQQTAADRAKAQQVASQRATPQIRVLPAPVQSVPDRLFLVDHGADSAWGGKLNVVADAMLRPRK